MLTVYPRACGGTARKAYDHSRTGSEVYPRACGGTKQCLQSLVYDRRVYPRACGGTLEVAEGRFRSEGSIPAPAGEPQALA